ncbi:MAG: serine/threonine protein kinase, partial [bacterium]
MDPPRPRRHPGEPDPRGRRGPERQPRGAAAVAGRRRGPRRGRPAGHRLDSRRGRVARRGG